MILVRRDDPAIRQYSALVNSQMDISSGKRWRTEEKVSILYEPELSSEIPVLSSNPRTFRKYNQSCIARQCTVTRRFYRVFFNTSETEKSCEVNRDLKTGRQAVFCTVVNPMDNQDGLGETLCDLPQARIVPYKNTWKHFQDTVHAQQRGLQFYQTRSNAVILYDTLPAEFILKAICMKTKDQLYQWESVILRPRAVSKLIRKMVDKIYQYKKQDHLGNPRCGKRRGNPKQHCWLSSSGFFDLNGETAGCTATK